MNLKGADSLIVVNQSGGVQLTGGIFKKKERTGVR